MIVGNPCEWYQDEFIGGYFADDGHLVVCEEYEVFSSGCSELDGLIYEMEDLMDELAELTEIMDELNAEMDILTHKINELMKGTYDIRD